jgi:hypothetical protein
VYSPLHLPLPLPLLLTSILWSLLQVIALLWAVDNIERYLFTVRLENRLTIHGNEPICVYWTRLSSVLYRSQHYSNSVNNRQRKGKQRLQVWGHFPIPRLVWRVDDVCSAPSQRWSDNRQETQQRVDQRQRTTEADSRQCTAYSW